MKHFYGTSILHLILFWGSNTQSNKCMNLREKIKRLRNLLNIRIATSCDIILRFWADSNCISFE